MLARVHDDDRTEEIHLGDTIVVEPATPAPANDHEYPAHRDTAELGSASTLYEEFHPFGTTSYAANDAGIEVSAKRYRYIGKERDEETGLYHLGARYYASWLGRWTAADPIGLGDGVNRYAYGRGNPVRFRDLGGNKASEGDIVGDLALQQGALVLSLPNAASEAERSQIKGELRSVNAEIGEELGRLAKAEGVEREIARLDVSDRIAQADLRRANRRELGSVKAGPRESFLGKVAEEAAIGAVPGVNVAHDLEGIDEARRALGSDPGLATGALLGVAILATVAPVAGDVVRAVVRGIGDELIESGAKALGDGGAGTVRASSGGGIATPHNKEMIDISMDEAIERAAAHVGGKGVVETTGKGLNFQFRSTRTTAAGDVETRIGRFDVNPADGHVSREGAHLNLETQINKVIRQNQHVPIDPRTVRSGDKP